jgi:hypothetical protein
MEMVCGVKNEFRLVMNPLFVSFLFITSTH